MKNKTFLILKKELREVFRDKKSLAMMLIIPIMIPFIVVGLSYLFASEEDKQQNYGKIGLAYLPTQEEQLILKELKVSYESSSLKEIKDSYKKENIRCYITKDKDNYTIYYDENNVDSAITTSLAEEYLKSLKEYYQSNYLKEKNINSEEVFNIIKINHKSIAKKEDNFFANYITTYAFLFIIMAITISATYPATDATAGEKERGTMETLLTFPIRSKDIILGKFLSVSISSIITGLLGLVLSLISLKYVEINLDIYKGLSLIPNPTTLIITVLIIICYSLLISCLCIAIASMSKTFKEAQSALTPITFISFFPGMIAFMINIKTNLLISIIPFLNFVQIFSDTNSNKINVLYILSMFLSTIIYITIVLSIIIKQYKNEKVLF